MKAEWKAEVAKLIAERAAKIAKDCPPGMRPVKLRGTELRAVNAGHMPQRYVPIEME